MNNKLLSILIVFIETVLFIAMPLSMIIIVLTLITHRPYIINVYTLYSLSMIMFYLLIYMINSIINGYNKMDNNEYIKNIKNAINILTMVRSNALSILITFFIIFIFVYTIYWLVTDMDIIYAIIGYILLVCGSIFNGVSLIIYAKDLRYFNNRLHKEVLK